MAVDPPAGAWLSNGTAVVTATPAPGWTFLQWLGDATGTNPVASVSMSRTKCVQAVFGAGLGHTVVGSGSVARSPAAALYPHGTAVRLTAVPQAGNYFALWGNAANGTNNPFTFTVTNANAVVTAVFAALPANQHVLTVLPEGYVIEATTSFALPPASTVWTPLATVTNSFGAVQFNDPFVTNRTQRFYRAVGP